MRHLSIVIALATACFVASPAFAAHKRKRVSERHAAAPARVCQPLCQADMSPCDPPEFKRADGRCDFGAYSGAGGGFR